MNSIKIENINYSSQIRQLAKLQIALEKKGGPSEDGHLFEKILSLQDEILKRFGLPSTIENIKLVQFESVPSELESESSITELKMKATEYLLSNAKSDLQILRDAQELQQDAFMVLPELKIETHIYTLFVYNKILLKGKDNLESILTDLKFVSQNAEILDALGQLEQGTLDNEHETTAFLENIGVKYIEQFIIHNSNLLRDDDY